MLLQTTDVIIRLKIRLAGCQDQIEKEQLEKRLLLLSGKQQVIGKKVIELIGG